MDELTMLGTALAGPAPSRDVVERSRHRLQNVMRGAPAKPRSRKRWIVVGIGAGAGLAATAAVVVSNPSTPAPAKDPVLSGQQVMLAAAIAAESKPAGSGKYWHTRSTGTTGKITTVDETWIARDGRTWISAAPGLVSRVKARPVIPYTRLGYADVQRLPTDPGRLKTKLLKSSSAPAADGQRQLVTINMLQALLGEVPAPPKVRAAAYRALASLPDIANLGRTAGGYRLKISYMNSAGTRVEGTETIVVDPKSAQLRVEGWAGFGDGPVPVGPSRSASGWTDRITGRIVPWSAQIPYIEELNARANGD